MVSKYLGLRPSEAKLIELYCGFLLFVLGEGNTTLGNSGSGDMEVVEAAIGATHMSKKNGVPRRAPTEFIQGSLAR